MLLVACWMGTGLASVNPAVSTLRPRPDLRPYFFEESLSLVLSLRAGSFDDEYDDDDGYDIEDDDDDDVEMTARGDGPGKRSPYDHSLIDPPSDNDRVRRPPHSQRSPPRRPSYRSKRPPHWSQRLATQSVKMGSQLAWGAVKQTGNLAYQLVKPRHVEDRELLGLWRLDQQVVNSNSRGGSDLVSVATIELDPRKRLLTLKLPNGKKVVEPYGFKKTRLGNYKTEFVAPAFLVGESPRLYGYKGTWQRKLADQNVIKLVGKIYEVRKQRFGNRGRKYPQYQFVQPVGTFVARRRLQLSEDEEEEDFDDDYDNYNEYDGQGLQDLDENDFDGDTNLSNDEEYED